MPVNPFLYKICVVGNEHAGKVNMVYRQLFNKFPAPPPTIGGPLPVLPVIEYWFGNTDKTYGVRIVIWINSALRPRKNFWIGASCVILVFDSNDPRSLHDLRARAETAHESIGKKVQFVLVGSKCDLRRKVDDSEVQRISQEIEAQLFWTSAKTGSGLDDVFRTAALLAHETAGLL